MAMCQAQQVYGPCWPHRRIAGWNRVTGILSERRAREVACTPGVSVGRHSASAVSGSAHLNQLQVAQGLDECWQILERTQVQALPVLPVDVPAALGIAQHGRALDQVLP